MNEKNFEYLKDNIRNHGFGDTLQPSLEEQLKKGAAEFHLSFKQEFNKKEIEATLYFKKSDSTDMYFFNNYDARTQTEKDATMAQTFYLNEGRGITLKEAYNLLNGRAVHKELTNKEGEKYQAWVQLDFGSKDKNGNYDRKLYHQNYGYDIKEALSYYPIKEMLKEDTMKDLIKSLERGNAQMVTLQTPDKDTRVFIEANPQYKSLNVYTNKMVSLDKEQREELMKKPEMNDTKSKNQQQALAGEDKGEKKSVKTNRKNSLDNESNGLVTKKRNGSSKGMGVH